MFMHHMGVDELLVYRFQEELHHLHRRGMFLVRVRRARLLGWQLPQSVGCCVKPFAVFYFALFLFE